LKTELKIRESVSPPAEIAAATESRTVRKPRKGLPLETL
jgi:hypothetical protein